MYYKYEMHCHDHIASGCGDISPENLVKAYKAVGYSGLVITNHFLNGNTAVNRRLPWKEKIAVYEDSYLRAKAEGGQNFTVLFGLEYNYGDGKEVLSYGIEPEFLYANPDIDRVPLAEFCKLVKEYGGYISQAHPFRTADYINPFVLPQIECLDAMEVYNWCNKDVDNKEALDWANKYSLGQTSGGDVHGVIGSGLGEAGMAFTKEIKTNKELVLALKNREGRLIIKGNIVD